MAGSPMLADDFVANFRECGGQRYERHGERRGGEPHGLADAQSALRRHVTRAGIALTAAGHDNPEIPLPRLVARAYVVLRRGPNPPMAG
jgi:hypothetical protein